MITCGFWCDECRRKYVRHICKERRLPCGHSYWDSIYVECQAFARSGEHVRMEFGPPERTGSVDVWVTRAPRDGTMFGSDSAFEYWGMVVRPFGHEDDWEMRVGEWLASRPDGFVRAYLNRWDSSKWVPEWLSFREHPWAKRACAVMVLPPLQGGE